MLSLIVAILFGLSITFFAFQNSVGVPIVMGNFFLQNVPVYLVVIFSILVGILMAWFISALEGVSHLLQVRRKDSVINLDKKEITALQGRIHNLEVENARLKNTSKDVVVDKKPVHVSDASYGYKPSLMERLFPSSHRTYTKQV